MVFVCDLSEALVKNEFMHGVSVRLDEMSKFFLDLICSETSILGIGSDGKRNCAIELEANRQNLDKSS